MVKNRALVVGINDYDTPNELYGCVNDATAVGEMLRCNGDDGNSPNFDVIQLTSDKVTITSERLMNSIHELFSLSADIVLLYFAGHGSLDAKTNTGWIVTQDGSSPNWGVNLASILELANKANPDISSTVIILDSCQSGFVGEITGMGSETNISHIGAGVTILTACHKNGYAADGPQHGAFTGLLLDGLAGASADVLGRITPASLYSHIDQTLGAWEQRPIYKANVENFIELRKVEPSVSKNFLRKLHEFFPDPKGVLALDPSFEPDRGEEAEKHVNVPVNDENVKIYRNLQKCNRAGLVVPHEQEHMWHAAVYSTGCKLTATGRHYRKLASLGRIE